MPYAAPIKPGNTFGELVVVEEDTSKKEGGYRVWWCHCEGCGGSAYVPTNKLRNGRVVACPDCSVPKKRGPKPKERDEDGDPRTSPVEPGKRYGKLTVIKRTDEKQHWSYLWECRCDCGQTRKVQTGHLRGGRVKMCKTCRGPIERKWR